MKKHQELTKKERAELLAIAKEYIVAMEIRGDFERRWNDEEDFIETSVSAIETALEAAYRLGKQNGSA